MYRPDQPGWEADFNHVLPNADLQDIVDLIDEKLGMGRPSLLKLESHAEEGMHDVHFKWGAFDADGKEELQLEMTFTRRTVPGRARDVFEARLDYVADHREPRRSGYGTQALGIVCGIALLNSYPELRADASMDGRVAWFKRGARMEVGDFVEFDEKLGYAGMAPDPRRHPARIGELLKDESMMGLVQHVLLGPRNAGGATPHWKILWNSGDMQQVMEKAFGGENPLLTPSRVQRGRAALVTLENK